MNKIKFWKPNGERITIPISQTNKNLWVSSEKNRAMTKKQAVHYADLAGYTLRTRPKIVAEAKVEVKPKT